MFVIWEHYGRVAKAGSIWLRYEVSGHILFTILSTELLQSALEYFVFISFHTSTWCREILILDFLF